MRVGINATSLNDRPSGAKQRFVGLYGALFRANPEVDYLIYEPSDCRIAQWFADLPNVRGIATPLPSGDRWKRFLFGLGYWDARLRRDQLSLFETLHLPLIKAPDCPTVLTVHDARPVLADVPAPRRAVNRFVLRHALRRADRVVTVSDAMRAELMNIEPRAVVTTIYNGIVATPLQAPDAPLPPQLANRFILAVGHFEPRKNYPALIAAMERLPDLHLAIVGKDGGTLAATAALTETLGLGSRLHLLNDVDDATLASMYAKAGMLIFPSTYEGFGIPILEAMAAGTPMALSDLPVFRELAGDGAAYFDPRDPASIAAVIAKLLASPERQAEQRRDAASRIADFAFPPLAARLAALHRDLTHSRSDQEARAR